jgi:hypothetical protein
MAKQVFIISYDVDDADRDTLRSLIVDTFKGIMLTKSTYAIYVDRTAASLCRLIADTINLTDNDRVIVIPAHGPYDGFLNQDTHDWLGPKLPDPDTQ